MQCTEKCCIANTAFDDTTVLISNQKIYTEEASHPVFEVKMELTSV